MSLWREMQKLNELTFPPEFHFVGRQEYSDDGYVINILQSLGEALKNNEVHDE